MTGRRGPTGVRRLFETAIRAVAAATLLAWPCTPLRTAQADPPDAGSIFCAETGAMPGLVAAGPGGTTFVAGLTGSTSLPASLPAPPAATTSTWFFVTAFAADASPRWTAYIAVEGSWAEVSALRVAPDGSVWLGGLGPVAEVNPPPSPCVVARDWLDGWFAKISMDGEVVTAANVGGGFDDWVTDLAVDAQGRAVVVGSSRSADFPCDTPKDSQVTFALRVSADGSAYDWVRHLASGDAAGVAIGADGAPVVTFSWESPDSPLPSATPLAKPRRARILRRPREDRRTVVVARLDDTGTISRAVSLDFVGYGVTVGGFNFPAAPVAVAPDGSIVVAGHQSVARLAGDLSRVEAVASAPHGYYLAAPRRLSFDTAGRLLVRWEVNAPYPDFQSSRVDVLTPALRPAPVRWPVPGTVLDLCAGSSGTVHVVSEDAGLRFGEPAALIGIGGRVVSRVPFEGVRPPSRVTAVARSSDSIELSWPGDGDPATAFWVERMQPDDFSGGPWEFVMNLPGDARSYRDTGLRPATRYRHRIVAAFANGGRTLADSRDTVTYPATPLSVSATRSAPQTVTVTWDGLGAAGGSIRLQRRVGTGAWLDIGWFTSNQFPGAAGSVDNVLTETAQPVQYRVAMVTNLYQSRWGTSAPMQLEPTLLVTQTAGSFGFLKGRDRRLVVKARLASRDASVPLEFSQATQPLRMLLGDSHAPFDRTIPANDPGWARVGNVYEWYAPPDDPLFPDAPAVVLDLERGEFRAILRSDPLFLSTEAGSFEVGVSFGEFRGGEVREWTRTSRIPPRFELR